MKYIEILVPIFRIYQLCGFAPFKIPLDARKDAHQQVSHFWQIYNGLFLIYLSVLVFFNIVLILCMKVFWRAKQQKC